MVKMSISQEMITRINELYHKSKQEGLTPEEISEQKNLRKEYIQAIKTNMRSTLNNVSILEPDGSVTELKKFDKTNRTDLN